MKKVYLDHNATTPLDPSVIESFPQLLESWGNPSSVHSHSRAPKTILRETRKLFSELFLTHPGEIIFNSGASEGNTTVFQSVWNQYGLEKPDYFISAIEHPCVIKVAQYLKSKGAQIFVIPVSRSGFLDLNFLRKNISAKTALVSVMLANNEIGSLFPVGDVIEIAKQHGCLVHSDCVQGLGKHSFNLRELALDYATFSAHKFYGLKGTGILYVKKGSPLTSLIFGGAQERSRRGGTENVLGIASLGLTLKKYHLLAEKIQFMRKLRDQLEADILKLVQPVSITAIESERLANTTSLTIEGVDGEVLLMSLDLDGFSVSTGAACSSGSPEPSPVLLAIGLSREEAQKSLRISIGWNTTTEDINLFLKSLKICVDRIRSANLFEKQSQEIIA